MSDEMALRALPVDEVIRQVGVARAIPIKRVASLLFTYRCSIACDHCLFSCQPHLPPVRTSLADGVEFLRQLRGTDRVIHVAGGEAMLYYDELLAICQAAGAEGVGPHFVESNASWCKSEAIARKRLTALREAGLPGFYLSADPYHQKYVSPSNYRVAYEVAVEVFGQENVAASGAPLEQLAEWREIGRDPARLGEYARQRPPRLTGRAAEALGQYFPDRPLDELDGDAMWGGAPEAACRSQFDPESMWEIHIDPYGNIQTCCGIVVGNVHRKPLLEAMAEGFTQNELIQLVYERGPRAYLALARERGYEPREGYKQKCELCWEARKYLRPFYPETFGPAEIYDQAAD